MLGVHHVTRCKPLVLQAGCSAQFHLLEFTSTGKLTDRIIELSWDPAFSVVFIRLLQHITHAVVSPKPIETPRPIWPPEFLPCSGRGNVRPSCIPFGVMGIGAMQVASSLIWMRITATRVLEACYPADGGSAACCQRSPAIRVQSNRL